MKHSKEVRLRSVWCGAAIFLASELAFANNILVTGDECENCDPGHIYEFTPDGTNLGQWESGGPELDGPAAVRVGPDGRVYVLNGGQSVERYNGRTGAYIDTFVGAYVGGLHEGKDMVFGPDGRLYISANVNDQLQDPWGGEGGRVMVFDGKTGRFLGDAVPTRSGGNGIFRLSEAMALSFGPDGVLYVGNDPREINGGNTAYNVLKFQVRVTAAGVVRPPVFKGVAVRSDYNYLQDPNGMTWGKDGKLYIAWEDDRYNDVCGNSWAGAVTRYDPKTGYVDEPITGAYGASICFTEAQAIGFGPGGYLYVGSGDSADIFKFQLNGSATPPYWIIDAFSEPKGLTFIQH